MSERVARLKRFHDTMSFEGRDDRIRRQDEAAGLYRALGPDEARELAAFAIGAPAPDGDRYRWHEEILLCLACLRPGSLGGLHDALLDRGIIYPPVMWHGAGPGVASRIVAMLPGRAPDRRGLDRLLLALAWIGDGAVQDAFHRWRDDPPEWAGTLRRPPHRYSEQAGWELTAEGTRRDLFARLCHPLVEPNGRAADAGIARIVSEHEESCRRCGRPLTTLLDLDLAWPGLSSLGLDGRHLIAATVGPHLDPVLLSLEQHPDYSSEFPGARFSKLRAERPNRFRIHHRVAEDLWRTLDLPETDENYHAIQSLGDEEWLLVRGRADDEGDRNAHVHDASGGHLRSFHAGDGIQDVQATRVGYFDEGAFGRTRFGQAGLVRLDGSGHCSFEFNRQAAGVPGIADCYVLNVTSDREVWLYYYKEFPLVRLVDGKVDRIWSSVPVEGSPAFAVRAAMVLFAGGYDRRDGLMLARFDDKRARVLVVTDEGGRPLEGFTAFGRRDRLFLQTGEALYVVEVPDRLPGGTKA